MRPSVLGIIFMGLAECAALIAAPAAVAQSQDRAPDRNTDCAAIASEVDANKAKIAELEKGAWWERNQMFSVCCDPAAFLASTIVLGARVVHRASENKEIADLQQRQQDLATLTEQRCAPPAAPVAKTAKKAKRH